MGLVQVLALLLIVAAVASAATFRPSESVARNVSERWGELVRKYSQFHPTIPASWILAMICVESAGDPDIVGDEDLTHRSTGLLQIRWPALQDFNKAFSKSYLAADLTTPYVNIEAGFGYMDLRYRRWKDLDKATMAYNGGDGNVGSSLTMRYLDRVKAYHALILKLKG